MTHYRSAVDISGTFANTVVLDDDGRSAPRGSPAGTGPTVVACSAQRNANPELAMIDLYAMGSPNVVKIYIAL